MRIQRFIFLVCFLALGCSGSRTAPVSGKITLDGKPLKNARVNFQPLGDAVNTGVGSFGRTDANGDYSLTLIDESASGAVVGKHRVTVSLFDKEPDPADDRQRGPQDRVPRKYNIASELTFDVKPGANTADFELTTGK